MILGKKPKQKYDKIIYTIPNQVNIKPISQTMFRFIAYLQITPQLKRQLKITTAITLGLTFGYWKAHIVNQKYINVNNSKLTPYQNEDQISMLIEKQKKPAIIYYALPINKDHCFYRQMMFKYSNMYPDKAIWMMVNIKQKFQQVKSSFDFQYPTRTMLEVRFPKSQVAIKLGDNPQFIELKEKAHRREPYNYNVSEEGFKKFLELNRIIEGSDPIKSVLNVTRNALFSHIQKPDKKN